MIVGVFGGPLGLDFDHLGVPGRSLRADFDHFRAPRKASGAKICNFVIQHFNFLKKRKTAATWSRPAEIFRSKYRFLSTSIAVLKQKLLKMRPSTRGSKFQNAEPPCAGSNRVSSNAFFTGALRKACLHDAICIGLSGGSSCFFFGIGGCERGAHVPLR